MFYNSFNALNNSPLLECPHNNNSLFWDEKVEFELSTLNDTTNIWNNSTIIQPLEVTETTQEPTKSTNNLELMLDTVLQLDQIEEQDTTRSSLEINTQAHKKYKQQKADLISTKGNEEQETTEQMTHYAPAPTPELANMGMNMSFTETQTQATMELPDKEINQVTMGLNLDTNSSEMEMIDPTENRSTFPQVTETGTLDPEVNTSVQQEAPEGTPIPDEIDTLGSTSNTVTQHQESYLLEMTTKDTLPGEAEWLSSEGFTPVVNK
ncbi:40056_t:CDS:2 [Gigaspora margarita]|uniref:40056_t:CDS:1 n=1 Tax=Gigaspora margarita TaxID=4874 RepID=A0ABM8W5R3_GIGMA|nr:40056_t:CDS:2 [Gigaspora margarita]